MSSYFSFLKGCAEATAGLSVAVAGLSATVAALSTGAGLVAAPIILKQTYDTTSQLFNSAKESFTQTSSSEQAAPKATEKNASETYQPPSTEPTKSSFSHFISGCTSVVAGLEAATRGVTAATLAASSVAGAVAAPKILMDAYTEAKSHFEQAEKSLSASVTEAEKSKTSEKSFGSFFSSFKSEVANLSKETFKIMDTVQSKLAQRTPENIKTAAAETPASPSIKSSRP